MKRTRPIQWRLGLLLVLSLLFVTAITTGCNTMEGLGEDIEDAGDALQDEAR